MSVVKIDQAFVSSFIAASFGLDIAHENLPYEPVTGTPYAEIKTLQNDVTGYDLSALNLTDGVFQVVLRYPAGSGAITPKIKADEIINAFPIGSLVTYQGQAATIMSQQRQPGVAEAGWYSIVITLGYRAKLARGNAT